MGHALSTVFPFDPFKLPLELKPDTPAWKLNQPWPHTHSFDNAQIGKIGEDLAAQYLTKCGYKPLYRNFDPPNGGEIDIICRHHSCLVFVEVKTRVSPIHRPLTAVNKSKFRYLRKGAAQYLRMLDHKPEFRIDVVEVTLTPDAEPDCNLVKRIYS